MSSTLKQLDYLLGSHESEKTTLIAEAHNQYVLKVAKVATKDDIKAAVEEIFNVTVLSINTVSVPGKARRTKFSSNGVKTRAWKKAYITLKEGDVIEISE